MAYMAKARIAYNGPALDQGLMDVRDLAPALMAFADLVNAANTAIGGDRKIQVMLNQDSLRKGSFDITTFLNYSILEQAKLFMSSAEESGLSDLMEILGWGSLSAGSVVGIFKLIKTIRGRRIKSANEDSNGQVQLVIDDKTIITTTAKTMRVYLNVDCRNAIEKVIQPLQQEGIDTFELRDPDRPDEKEAIESIHKNEAVYFRAPASSNEEKVENLPEQEMMVKIISLSFGKGMKWRLYDGNNTFWAKIEDERFSSQVDDGALSFRNGDMLRIKYYIRQTIKNDTLSSEYIVTKVLEMHNQPKQIALDFDIRK